MRSRQLRRAAERDQLKRSRAEINRANAQKSTGPKTAEGKAASSRNAFKHGLYAEQVATRKEDAAALDALRADLRAQHQPANDTEEILVNELAEQFWRIKRARIFEANILDSADPKLAQMMTAVQRLMSSAERGMYKAIAALRQLQKDRGFVPQTAEEPALEPQTQPQNVSNPTEFTRSATAESGPMSPLTAFDGSGGAQNT